MNINTYKIILNAIIVMGVGMSQNIKFYEKNETSFADVEVNELTFRCRVSGLDNKGSAIILLHGFPETSRMWSDLIELLVENDYRVIAPDQRGYSVGSRPLKVDEYKIDKLSQDIIDIADAFAVDKFHLVGHDWGSAVGWYLSSVEGERLLSWSALSVPHMDAFIYAMENDEIQKKKSTYISYFRKRFLPEFYFRIFNYKNLKSIWTHSSSEEIDSYINLFSQKDALKTALHWYRANFSGNAKKIGSINVPTLMISGTNDMAVGQVAVDETENYIKAPYTLKKIDAGHWLIQESFDEVSSYILDHIGKYNDR